MTGILALGYVGLEVSDLGAWKAFAQDQLGLQWVEQEDGTVDLRLDAYAARIYLHEGPRDDLAYAGWEVRDAAELAALADRIEMSGGTVERATTDAFNRHVTDLIRFKDPEGTTHEAFYGALQKTADPFVSPLGFGFKTGKQGLGHIVLSCRDKVAMMAFFEKVLSFRLSDHIRTEVVPGRPMEISFLRCNGRHHSLALAPVSIPKKLVHLMVESTSIDDVGRALHRCMAAGTHLSFTLGRHSNDEMLSFYPLSPSGFDIEFGWGGLEVDENSWHVLLHDRNSAWGHIYQRPPRANKPEESL